MPRQKSESSKELLSILSGVNIHSRVAVYLQIENLVQFAIASGNLKSGERLPSVRELSERLEVNPNTVAKSYRDLEVMGLLFTRRGMGVFVKKGVDAKCREECRQGTIARMHLTVAEAKAAGLSKQELAEMLERSWETDAKPYEEPPAALMQLAKRPKRSK